MIDWLTRFYADENLKITLIESFRPLFTTYAATIAPNPDIAFVDALTSRFVERYLDSSRAQLQEVLKDAEDPMAALSERFKEWTEKRPAKVRSNEIVRTANAMRMQDMQSSGVVKKVWRASGENCPYCKALNGKVIGVEEKFFESSSTFLPEGATEPLRFNSDKRHPPIHNGCDCSIEGVTE